MTLEMQDLVGSTVMTETGLQKVWSYFPERQAYLVGPTPELAVDYYQEDLIEEPMPSSGDPAEIARWLDRPMAAFAPRPTTYVMPKHETCTCKRVCTCD